MSLVMLPLKNLSTRFVAGIACSLLIVFLFLLSACDSQQEKPITIGILLFGDSRQPQVDGFIDEMKLVGYTEDRPTRYIVLNAKNDRKKLKTMVAELVEEQPDLLVAAGGLEADTMKKLVSSKKIPVVVLYVNAIIERGLSKTRQQAGWNVTGVDNLNAELSGKRVELINDMLPNTKRILILYYEKIAPSRIGVEHAMNVANKKNIVIDARAVKSRAEIENVLLSLKPGEVDVMLTVPTAPIDNALKDIILPQTDRLKIPLFTHSQPLARLGAFASYGANFYELGKQSARLAKKVLNGIDASNIPFETPKKYVYTINEDAKKSLSIDFTDIAKHQVNEFVNTRR